MGMFDKLSRGQAPQMLPVGTPQLLGASQPVDENFLQQLVNDMGSGSQNIGGMSGTRTGSGAIGQAPQVPVGQAPQMQPVDIARMPDRSSDIRRQIALLSEQIQKLQFELMQLEGVSGVTDDGQRSMGLMGLFPGD
jgi:hypothetical protein